MSNTIRHNACRLAVCIAFILSSFGLSAQRATAKPGTDINRIRDVQYSSVKNRHRLAIELSAPPTFVGYTNKENQKFVLKIANSKVEATTLDLEIPETVGIDVTQVSGDRDWPQSRFEVVSPMNADFSTDVDGTTLSLSWSKKPKATRIAARSSSQSKATEIKSDNSRSPEKPVGLARPVSIKELPFLVARQKHRKSGLDSGIVTFTNNESKEPSSRASQGKIGKDSYFLGAASRRPDIRFAQTSAPNPELPKIVVNPAQVDHVPGMSRKEMTIELRQADIHNVLQLIANEGNINIIASDNVSGSVTMELQSIPMDKVFLLIMQSLNLGFEARQNVIRVDTREALQQQMKQRQKARARQQMSKPLEVFLIPINFAEAGEIKAQITGLLSPRGSVSVDGRTNTLIVKDLPENIGPIRKLINSLDSEVPQVLIEARIVETNDTFERQIGIQWGGGYSFSAQQGNSTGLAFPNVGGISGGTPVGKSSTQGIADNPNFAVNMPAPAGAGEGGSIGFTMGSLGGDANLNLRLSAMESRGSAKIISAPKVLTLDNQQATISQGTSIPISQVSAAGVETVFVDATLQLSVTPKVTPEGSIRLSIQVTKNEPDFQNTGAGGDPTILRKQAQTKLLIDDGDTTVIGGIYTQNGGTNLSAVPFLYRIPLLGKLFKTRQTTESREELLIFITPKIVNRAESVGVLSAGGMSGSKDWDVSLEGASQQGGGQQ